MAARKAETETLEGSAAEARVKSAVVKLEVQPKVASSDQSYKANTQQIMYLMSIITNQNQITMEGGKFSKPQRPKTDRKDMIYWGCRGSGHGWKGNKQKR